MLDFIVRRFRPVPRMDNDENVHFHDARVILHRGTNIRDHLSFATSSKKRGEEFNEEDVTYWRGLDRTSDGIGYVNIQMCKTSYCVRAVLSGITIIGSMYMIANKIQINY